MPTIRTDDIQSRNMLFHNERIKVFPMLLPLENITFWKENNRTLFTFERLCRLKGKIGVNDLSIEEITKFIAEQDIHKLQILADSIARNGVLVPLIISDNGKLLDGNRRYFACQWLKMQYRDLPREIFNIPVYVIREADLSDRLELKILAEANFVPDLKTAWPLEAQARIVEEYYLKISKDKHSDVETVFKELTNIFGISRQRTTDLLDTLKLTREFIDENTDIDNRLKRRGIVEEKFLYFWEFQNKTTKGNRAYHDDDELREVKNMFFMQINKGRDTSIKNVKHVDSLVQAKRNRDTWDLLTKSKGRKLQVVATMMNNNKEMRKAEDRIRDFLFWLNNVDELNNLDKQYLQEVIRIAKSKV